MSGVAAGAARGAGPGRSRSLRRKLLLGTAVWVSLLLLAEVLVRVRERILYGTFARAGTTLFVPSTDGKIRLKPNAQFEGSRSKTSTSSLGFRGADVTVPKPKGVFRIVCIGGSTTFDIYARSNEDAWPARLERLLRAKHPRVEVVNAGVMGHTLADSLDDPVWPSVELVEPDLVFSYHAANEISRLSQRTFTPGAAYESRDRWSAVKLLTDWSLLAYKVWLVADAVMKPPEREGVGTLPASGPAEFEANLGELVRRTKARNARLALGTFALRWRGDQPLETRKRLAQGAANVFRGLSLAGIEEAFARYNAVAEETARASGALLVPVARELAGHEEYFEDCMHFSDEGSRKMAETLARALEDAKVLGD